MLIAVLGVIAAALAAVVAAAGVVVVAAAAGDKDGVAVIVVAAEEATAVELALDSGATAKATGVGAVFCSRRRQTGRVRKAT